MRTSKKIVSAIMVAVMILSTSVTAFAATNCSKGHKYDANHYCSTCNVFDSTYTGMAKDKTTWYYVKNGKIDTSYTGMAKNQYGWWYMKNGKLDKTYTGMAKNQYGWWYFQNGKLNKTYTGMAKNQYGWWYLTNGQIDSWYTGMAKNQYGWWYISYGKLDTTYNGLAKNQYGWWYMKNGQLDKTFNGVASNEYGAWNVVNGKVTTKANLKNFSQTIKTEYGTYTFIFNKCVPFTIATANGYFIEDFDEFGNYYEDFVETSSYGININKITATSSWESPVTITLDGRMFNTSCYEIWYDIYDSEDYLVYSDYLSFSGKYGGPARSSIYIYSDLEPGTYYVEVSECYGM